ncbi:MAG: thiamine phosphate synthase [Pirellulales bacterium]
MPIHPKQSRLSCPETAVLRVVDASINRAMEGLRVVEDFVRFVQDDLHLSHLTKAVRHDLASWVSDQIPHAIQLHGSRETIHDVGTQITVAAETHRETPMSVCTASFQRIKQALRSLEEFAKLTTPQHAVALEALRYRVYTLERCVTLAVSSCERLKASQLCVLIDSSERDRGSKELGFSTLVKELVEAGVGTIQLRDKQLGDANLIARARRLVELTRPSPSATSHKQTTPWKEGPRQVGQWEERRTLAIINDRPDIAAITLADGVHLGQDDMSVKDARMIVGPQALIGRSTHSIEQARTAVLDGANYLGVGPTFPSSTKVFTDFPGLKLLRQVAKEISLPAYAIGGIHADNLEQVLATGIKQIAVSGAVARNPNPRAEAGKLIRILEG